MDLHSIKMPEIKCQSQNGMTSFHISGLGRNVYTCLTDCQSYKLELMLSIGRASKIDYFNQVAQKYAFNGCQCPQDREDVVITESGVPKYPKEKGNCVHAVSK